MPVNQLYELTPSQELSLLNRHWTLHKSIINIATSVRVHAHLDRGLLEAAVRLCVQRWDSFGIRFVKRGGTYRQHFGERSCLYVEQLQFDDDAELERVLAERARRRIPLGESPQAGFIVFTTADGSTGLFSVITHLIMDSWAISMFYRDVIDVYWALAYGEPLPKPPRDYEPVLAEELTYQNSARSAAAREFWEREWAASQPLFNSIKGSQVLARYRRLTRNPEAREAWIQHLRTKADHVVRVVDAADVARFRAFLDAHQLPSLQAMFVLALRTYLAKVNGRPEEVTMGVNVARRATLAEKNTGGSRVANLTLRTTMPASMTFLEAIELVLEKQNTLFRYADFSSIEMFEMQHRIWAAAGSRPGMNYYDVLLTFQPVPMVLGHGLTCTTDWHCNGAFSLLSYLTVMDDDGSGGLRCYWERQVRHLPVAVIDDCHDFMVQVMRAGAERPTITLGELMDLDAGGRGRTPTSAGWRRSLSMSAR